MADTVPTTKDLESLSEFLRKQEKLKAETKKFAESWSEVQQKIVGSLNPFTSFQKQINRLGEDRKRIEKNLLELENEKNRMHKDDYDMQRKIYESQLKQNTKAENSLEKQKAFLNLMYDTVKKIVEMYDKYDQLLSENAKVQGTSKKEIDAQYDAIQRLNNTNDIYRVSNQEILASLTQMREQYAAISGKYIANIASNAAALSRATGLTAAGSSKFYETMAEIGGTSLGAQKNMEGVANLAAKAAGVPLGKVIKDVSNASASVRLIFKGNTTELIKQAAELRKIGSSLDSAAKSAESLLNFESSVGAELKASALLGKNVNFNESRRLFFAGKTAEAEKALQAELLKVGDLDKLNYLQKKALAELTGKDIGELQKMETTRKTMLEAEREFPELAEEKRAAEAELAKYQKNASEKRKEELAMAIRQSTAETNLKQVEEARAEVMNNIGKLVKPIGDFIRGVELAILRFLGSITSFKNDWGKLTVALLVGAGLMYGAFVLLKKGLIGLLELAAKGLDKLGESLGSGIGKGLKQLGGGIRSMSNALNTVTPAQIIKIAVILGILTLAVWGLAKAFGQLGNVSGEQIMSFTAALVALGASLVVFGAAMLIPGLQVGMAVFAAGLLAIGLAAMEFGFALKMAGPAVDSIGKTLTSLAGIVDGVIIKAFDTMLAVFQSLPAVIDSLANGLVKIADIGYFKLAKAAVGVSSLATSLGDLGVSISKLPVDKFSNFVSQLALLSDSAEGITYAISSLKDLSGLELPTLDMDVKGTENLAKMSESKEKQTAELKAGLDMVVQKLETLTSLMSNGGIAVNIDGQLVSRQLSTTYYRSGGFGQSTTRS